MKRLPQLDCLRGLASLAVCWFHLTNGNRAFLPDGWLKSSGAYGWLGVETFFVISGFVIPYALFNANYSLRSYGRFIAKRMVRLDPPYLLSIALVIAFAYISAFTPGFRGQSPHYTLKQILLHLGYANFVFGYQWVNIVYWTLAIEFQYYLLVGLISRLLASQRLAIRLITISALCGTGFFVGSESYLPHWLSLFV